MADSASDSSCWLRPDSFLTGLLDRPCFSLAIPKSINWEESEILKKLYKIIKKKPTFIYAKAATVDIATISCLETLGFRLVDTNVQLEKNWAPALGAVDFNRCRFARPDDRDTVAQIAGESFGFTRFHLDPLISQVQADAIKAAWASNYFSGQRGQAMVVGEIEGRIQGFLQLLFVERSLIIDLIAVHQQGRRQRLANDLIAFAQMHLEGFDAIQVGTQIANIPSLNFYQHLGFHIKSAHYVLHSHTGASS